jgi:ElaB/YqjD/DUF883 family membrane-anchored ribosome-binding protein
MRIAFLVPKLLGSLALVVLAAPRAWADEAPETVVTSPWAAITIFAIVIGMIAGITIWRRRR